MAKRINRETIWAAPAGQSVTVGNNRTVTRKDGAGESYFDARIARATAAFATAITCEDRQAAFDAVCEWVADKTPENSNRAEDRADIERAARAEIYRATGIRTPRMHYS
jgi:uncharacterized membrane protein